MKKAIVLLLTVATLVSCMTIYASAEDDYPITPYYANIASSSTSFYITSSGVANVGAYYSGFSGAIASVKSEIYLEKKFLGIFWTRVDIGVPDNVWIDYSYSESGSFYHEFQLSDTGTYKAVFKMTVYGTSGAEDVIENDIDYKY